MSGTLTPRLLTVTRGALFAFVASTTLPVVMAPEWTVISPVYADATVQLLSVSLPAGAWRVVGVAVLLVCVLGGVWRRAARWSALGGSLWLLLLGSGNSALLPGLATVTMQAFLLALVALGHRPGDDRPLRLAWSSTVLVGTVFAGIWKLIAGWPTARVMSMLVAQPAGFLKRDWWAAWELPAWVGASMAIDVVVLAIECLAPIFILWGGKVGRIALVSYLALYVGIAVSLRVPLAFPTLFALGGCLALGLRIPLCREDEAG